jgi:hypothetical protein
MARSEPYFDVRTVDTVELTDPGVHRIDCVLDLTGLESIGTWLNGTV